MKEGYTETTTTSMVIATHGLHPGLHPWLHPGGVTPRVTLGVTLERYNIKAWKNKAFLGIGLGCEDVNYYDITQFIETSIYQSTLGMPSAKGGKVSANKALEDLSAANTGLSQVSPTMWFSANVKIQARLMEERKLDGDGIYGYLAHMLKVSNFCAHNTWSSVLSYDRAFRINQALSKCSWGEAFPCMSGAYLVRKMLDKFAGNSVQGNKPGRGKQTQPGRGRGWNKDEQGAPGEGDSQKNGKCQL